MARNAESCVFALVLLCGAALGPACRQSKESGTAGSPEDSTPSSVEKSSPAEAQSPDPASSSGAEETEIPAETAAGEKDSGASSGALADPESAMTGAEEPAPPPEVKPVDPTPTPVDGLKMTVTESGLKYWDIRVGDGEIPDPNATIRVIWRAWFADGSLFDSSDGVPRAYNRTGAIKGFYEGIWSMRVGGIRRLEVPPELAYGPKGKPPLIPANATVIFEVELVQAVSRRQQAPFDHLPVITTPSGLRYRDFKAGDGERPSVRCTLEMHYAFWLEDGTLIADTMETEIPPKLRMGMLAPGWAEGVSTMREGGKRRLEIPPELGYAEAGGPLFPPDADLIVEVELVSVEHAEPWPPPAPVEGIKSTTTPAGVTYWDMEEGFGRWPDHAGTVLVHLTAWLSDDTMYESTHEAGKRVALTLAKEVPGLAEGIRTMKVGGKRRLKIPPKLGYGEKGRPGIVPPNATLTMEVELFGFTE